MECMLHFATPIGVTKINESTCDLARMNVEKIIRLREEGTTYSPTGECTPDDLNLREEFFDLKNEIEEYAHSFSDEIVGINPDDITMTCMWANTHKNGGKHHVHQHPNSFISGVVYLQCPRDAKDVGNIFFVDPRPAKNMFQGDYQKHTSLSERNIWVTPQQNMLILFPSWLEHGTEPFLTRKNSKRISLSFNFVLNKASGKTLKIK